MSSSEIKVTWAKPNTVDCPLVRYGLDFYQDSHYECGKLQIFDVIYFNSTEFEHVVRDLYAFTEYGATVTAYTNGGGGPPDSVLETTYETVPTEPRDVLANGISDTEINVTWSAPMCPNGTVISYKILYWQSTYGNITNAVVAPQDCIDYTEAFSCSIGELQPETNYSIQVSAENGCCFSEWSDTAQGGTLTVQAKPPASGSSVGVIIFTSITLTLVIILVVLFLLGYLYKKRSHKYSSPIKQQLSVCQRSNDESPNTIDPSTDGITFFG
ncbi:ephrin type-A receptor 4-A-like [Ptychodera flava]|uniref:ephrin type-A receptor 4-A-like n=1 Tax=Ptychodera flava TaxID=63121 RepID=UPI00396AAC7D